MVETDDIWHAHSPANWPPRTIVRKCSPGAKSVRMPPVRQSWRTGLWQKRNAFLQRCQTTAGLASRTPHLTPSLSRYEKDEGQQQGFCPAYRDRCIVDAFPRESRLLGLGRGESVPGHSCHLLFGTNILIGVYKARWFRLVLFGFLVPYRFISPLLMWLDRRLVRRLNRFSHRGR